MYLCVKIFNKIGRKLSDVRLNTAVRCNSVKKKNKNCLSVLIKKIVF